MVDSTGEDIDGYYGLRVRCCVGVTACSHYPHYSLQLSSSPRGQAAVARPSGWPRRTDGRVGVPPGLMQVSCTDSACGCTGSDVRSDVTSLSLSTLSVIMRLISSNLIHSTRCRPAAGVIHV